MQPANEMETGPAQRNPPPKPQIEPNTRPHNTARHATRGDQQIREPYKKRSPVDHTWQLYHQAERLRLPKCCHDPSTGRLLCIISRFATHRRQHQSLPPDTYRSHHTIGGPMGQCSITNNTIGSAGPLVCLTWAFQRSISPPWTDSSRTLNKHNNS